MCFIGPALPFGDVGVCVNHEDQNNEENKRLFFGDPCRHLDCVM